MIKVYISGQISGLDREFAQKNFVDAEVYLNHLGFDVVNPMKLNEHTSDWKWQNYMIEDIRELFECEAIFLLDNWRESRGARIELRIAAEMNQQIFTKIISGGKEFLSTHYLNQQCQLFNSIRLLDSVEITESISFHQRDKILREQGEPTRG